MENNHFFPLGNDQIFFGRGAPRALEPPSGTIPTQEMSKLSVLRIVVWFYFQDMAMMQGNR